MSERQPHGEGHLALALSIAPLLASSMIANVIIRLNGSKLSRFRSLEEGTHQDSTLDLDKGEIGVPPGGTVEIAVNGQQVLIQDFKRSSRALISFGGQIVKRLVRNFSRYEMTGGKKLKICNSSQKLQIGEGSVEITHTPSLFK